MIIFPPNSLRRAMENSRSDCHLFMVCQGSWTQFDEKSRTIQHKATYTRLQCIPSFNAFSYFSVWSMGHRLDEYNSEMPKNGFNKCR